MQRFVPRVVWRDDRLRDEASVPPEHVRLVGEAILGSLEGTFRDTPSSLHRWAGAEERVGGDPGGISKNWDDIVSAVRQVVKLFLINGFAYDGGVWVVVGPSSEISVAGATLEITFVGPATLWSGRALRVRR